MLSPICSTCSACTPQRDRRGGAPAGQRATGAALWLGEPAPGARARAGRGGGGACAARPDAPHRALCSLLVPCLHIAVCGAPLVGRPGGGRGVGARRVGENSAAANGESVKPNRRGAVLSRPPAPFISTAQAKQQGAGAEQDAREGDWYAGARQAARAPHSRRKQLILQSLASSRGCGERSARRMLLRRGGAAGPRAGRGGAPSKPRGPPPLRGSGAGPQGGRAAAAAARAPPAGP